MNGLCRFISFLLSYSKHYNYINFRFLKLTACNFLKTKKILCIIRVNVWNSQLTFHFVFLSISLKLITEPLVHQALLCSKIFLLILWNVPSKRPKGVDLWNIYLWFMKWAHVLYFTCGVSLINNYDTDHIKSFQKLVQSIRLIYALVEHFASFFFIHEVA